MEDKNILWTWAASDNVICQVPCFIDKLVLTSDGVGAGTVTIYNGFNTSGGLRLIMSVLQNETRQINFAKPMYMNSGIYLTFSANISGLFIGYHEE